LLPSAGVALPVQRIIFTLGLIVILSGIAYVCLKRIWTENVNLLGLFDKFSEQIPVKEPEGVIVSPAETTLIGGTWTYSEVCEVRNRSLKETAYSVWVKIWTPNGDLPPTIKVVTEKGDDFLSDEVGPGVVWNPDAVELIGKDSAGHRILCLLLYKIDAQQRRRFKFKQEPSTDVTASSDLSVLLAVKAWDRIPARIARQSGKMALQFSPPPDTLTSIEGMSALMYRKE
jgi:hypothetical protein